MGNISFPKSWSDAEVLTAADLNGNFTAVSAVVNGSLTDVNFGGSADINVTNIGDYSTNAAQYGLTTADPSDVGILATNLVGEITRLRGQIDLIVGLTDWFDTPDTSLAALNTSEQQFPASGFNLIGRNAGFDEEFDTSTATPNGWTQKGGATYLTSPTTNTQGSGQMLTITDSGTGGNADGLTRTVAGLKAGKVYGFSADIQAVDPADSGRIRVETSGGTDLALTIDGTADGNGWVVKSGTFTTDVTTPDVSIVTDLDDIGDVINVDNYSFVELFSTKSAHPPGQILQTFSTDTETLTSLANWTDWPANGTPTALEQGVVVHSPGYHIKVTVGLSLETSGASQDIGLRIVAEEDGGGATQVGSANYIAPSGSGENVFVSFHAIVANPTVGAEYLFRPEVASAGNVLCNPQGASAGSETIDSDSYVLVELIKD